MPPRVTLYYARNFKRISSMLLCVFVFIFFDCLTLTTTTHTQTHTSFFFLWHYFWSILHPLFRPGPGAITAGAQRAGKWIHYFCVDAKSMITWIERRKTEKKHRWRWRSPTHNHFPSSITFLSLFPPFSLDINWILFACAFFPSACSICTCTFRLLCIRRGWWLEEKSSNFANR